MFLFKATTQTAAMIVEQRMRWTLHHPSVSSLWVWVRYTCPSTATITITTMGTTIETPSPTTTSPPHPWASPTLCHPDSVCALTLRKGVSPSTTPTPCVPFGRVTSIALGPSALLSVSSAEAPCSCRSLWPIATQIRLRSGG